MSLKNTEKKEKSIVELTVEVSKEDFEAACAAAYKKNGKKITVPGFRKGKAPRKMIEKLYGSSFFWEDAVNESYSAAFEAALTESGTEPVGKADMEVLDLSENGYTFKAMVPVKPEVTISDYKGIEAEKGETTVEETDIDAELERMRKRNARIETVELPIASGDTAVIDYEGFLDGVPFEGGTAERFSLEIGSNSFIPGFEDQLIGACAGDERDLNLSFPETYHAENLAGKAVVFKVKVHEVKQTILPELDDEFVKDVSEFDTMADLRNDIRNNLVKSRSDAADNVFESSVYAKLAEKLQADIPDAMVDSQLTTLIENFSYRLSSQGLDIKSYLEMTGMTTDDLRSVYRPQAEQQVKLNLAFEKIAVLENLEVSTEELEAEYNKLAEQYNMPADKVKMLLAEDSLKSDLLMQKAADLVKSSAVAFAPAPEAETEEKDALKEEKSAKKETAKKTKKQDSAKEEKAPKAE